MGIGNGRNTSKWSGSYYGAPPVDIVGHRHIPGPLLVKCGPQREVYCSPQPPNKKKHFLSLLPSEKAAMLRQGLGEKGEHMFYLIWQKQAYHRMSTWLMAWHTVGTQQMLVE